MLEQLKLGASMAGSNSKIVTVYEGSESSIELSRLEGLLESIGCIPAHEGVNNIDFARFWMEESWGAAVTAATTADVIIVFLSGQSDLPVPVQRWVDAWPQFEQAHHHSLVIVFGNERSNPSKQNTLISYFQNAAESHGLDFFCNCVDAPGLSRLPGTLKAAEFDVMPLPA